MKLEHFSGIAAVGLLAFALGGCASGAQQAKAPPAPPVVGSTQLMSADVHVDSAEQLKVGKSQQHITDEAVSERNEDESVGKDPPRRSERHRTGGGFSGWK